jgi:hypothetical protein
MDRMVMTHMGVRCKAHQHRRRAEQKGREEIESDAQGLLLR